MWEGFCAPICRSCRNPVGTQKFLPQFSINRLSGARVLQKDLRENEKDGEDHH